MPKVKKQSSRTKNKHNKEWNDKRKKSVTEDVAAILKEKNKKYQKKWLSNENNLQTHNHLNNIIQIKRLQSPSKSATHRRRMIDCQKRRLFSPLKSVTHHKRMIDCQKRRLLSPSKSATHRRRLLDCQKRRLLSPSKSVTHRRRMVDCQKRRLLSPSKSVTHRRRMIDCQKRRLLSPSKSATHCSRVVHCQKRRLFSPTKSATHRRRMIDCQKRRLFSPTKSATHRRRMIDCQKKRLLSPSKSATHRRRMIDCQKKRLSQSFKANEHRQRIKICQKKRLCNDEKRKLHNIRQSNCQKIRLSNLRLRMEHRFRVKQNYKTKSLNMKDIIKRRNMLKKYQQRRLSNLSERLKQRKNSKELMQKLRTERLKKETNNERNKLFQNYAKNIKRGPDTICDSCNMLRFPKTIKCYNIDCLINLYGNANLDLIKQSCINYSESMSEIFLCVTCKSHIMKGRVPILSVANKHLQFPIIKPELLDLTFLEERFLCVRLPLMDIRLVSAERQNKMHGPVVNVPTDVKKSASILPRVANETATIPVALKKKTSFKTNIIYEDVRPKKIMDAIDALKDCPVYKHENIVIDKKRLQDDIANYNRSTVSLNSQNLDKIDKTNEYNMENVDEFVPEDEILNAPCDETLLMQETINFAPGENQIPRSTLYDKYSLCMSFFKTFGGQLICCPPGMSLQKWFKSLLMRSDRRCNKVPILFWMASTLRIQKMHDSISFCLRKSKCKNIDKITKANISNVDYRNELISHDSGYKQLSNDRFSPSFWQDKYRELLAMIRTLGPPTFFFTISAAETKWSELLCILYKLRYKCEITEENALKLSFQQKCSLLREDATVCAQYFQHKFAELFKLMRHKKFGIFGEHPVVDFYVRTEFQQGGSPHCHCLLWLKDSPKFKEYDQSSIADCLQFIDKIVTCTKDSSLITLDDIKLFQLHKHTFTCKRKQKNGNVKCRFGIPFCPMDKTCILMPIEIEDDKEKIDCKKKFNSIKEYLANQEVWHKENKKFSDATFDQFLSDLKMTKDEYINCIRTKLKKPTIFLKRNVSDININSYNEHILNLFHSNMDIQFILDTYACAHYVANYINKGNKGLSNLLNNVREEVLKGNYTLQQQMKLLGNKFIKAAEMSAQEAVYFLLSMDVSRSSRDNVFINTGPPQNRVKVVKRTHYMKNMPEESTDIFLKSWLDHYMNRPCILENLCLADFIAKYNYSTKEPNIINPKIENSDDENSDDNLKTLFNDDMVYDTSHHTHSKIYRLKNNDGFIKERKLNRIIRFVNYNIEQDEDNFFREQVMLFLPWRNEQLDILSIDYKKKYFLQKQIISAISCQYFHDNIDINEIFNKLQEEVNISDNLSDNLDVLEIETEENPYNVLNLSTDNVDLFDNVPKVKVSGDKIVQQDVSLIPTPHLMADENYYDLMRMLNEKQRKYLLHILHEIKCGRIVHELIIGSAGVGKSMLIKAIAQSVQRYENTLPGTKPDTIKVLIVAPTGKCAFQIGGTTLHSAFVLPVIQNRYGFIDLSANKRASIFSQLQDVKLIIMDECSMIGSSVFHRTNIRLNEIFGTDGENFANKSVIMLGDFNQSSPVLDNYIFEINPNDKYAAIFGNVLWQLFSIYELTEIMRQKEDKNFAECLNNFASGFLTTEELQLLKSRQITY